MALNLDARQRAMLQAMGITVWWPAPQAQAAARELAPGEMACVEAAPVETAAVATAAVETASMEPAAAAQPETCEQALAAPAAPALPAAPPQHQAAPAPQRPAQSAVASAPAPATLHLATTSETRTPHRYVQQPAAGAPGADWRLGPAQRVYPGAATQAEAPATGGWLILLEPPANPLPLSPAQRPGPECARTALQGDAARLLDNMLRALNLQQHPRVFSAALHRLPGGAQPAEAGPLLQAALPAMLEALRPDCVLVLGLASARAVLGRREALGPLRAQAHRVAGVPVVVTYDPYYLLRAPQAKAGAWADLCHAQVLAQSPARPA